MALFAGHLLLADATVEGWLQADGARLIEWGEGAPPAKPDSKGWIVPAPVNAHTHVGDSFLRDVPGKPRDVAQLVGPGGWKHTHLARGSPPEVAAGIQRTADEMAAIGTSRFLDFREGGADGVALLKDLAPELAIPPTVFGRPVRNTFDDAEAKTLLSVADGIGLSALRDFEDPADVERWAEACHRARKPFAMHASEAKREDIEQVLALEPAFLVHCLQATRSDLDAIADAEVPIVVCPRSNAHYGLKTPVDRMLDAGIQVAVGTDNGMLNDGNVLAELALLRAWFPKLSLDTLLRMPTWTGRDIAGLAPALPPKKGRTLDIVVLPERPLPEAGSAKPGFTGGVA